MKNLILFGAFTLIAFTSCRKDYTCSCVEPEKKFQYENLKKSEAEDACALQNTAWAPGTCSLD